MYSTTWRCREWWWRQGPTKVRVVASGADTWAKVQCLFCSENCTTQRGVWEKKKGVQISKESTQNRWHHKYLALCILTYVFPLFPTYDKSKGITFHLQIKFRLQETFQTVKVGGSNHWARAKSIITLPIGILQIASCDKMSLINRNAIAAAQLVLQRRFASQMPVAGTAVAAAGGAVGCFPLSLSSSRPENPGGVHRAAGAWLFPVWRRRRRSYEARVTRFIRTALHYNHGCGNEWLMVEFVESLPKVERRK